MQRLKLRIINDVNEMEMEEGTELSLSNLKAALMAYTEKTFRDCTMATRGAEGREVELQRKDKITIR